MEIHEIENLPWPSNWIAKAWWKVLLVANFCVFSFICSLAAWWLWLVSTWAIPTLWQTYT